MEQRIATQKPDAANPRFVTRNTVRHELSALNTALGVSGEARGIVLPRASIPRLEKNAVAWLSRREVARLLWTCRGRVWNAQANRWKIRADDDPSLAGTPEGSLRVIDERFARGPGKAMGRLIRLGVYSGSRHFVLIGANFFDEETLAHFDLGSGVLHRRGTRVAETTKRSPEIMMPVKLVHWTENWSREAQETGIARVVHKSDGTPYASISTYLWRRLCAAAGIDKRVTTHVLRHTCAMWLKLEGIPLDQAADYLGMTPKVLQQSYGKWDLRSTARPSAALNGCAGMKAAEAAMRRRGLL
jgi:integrase